MEAVFKKQLHDDFPVWNDANSKHFMALPLNCIGQIVTVTLRNASQIYAQAS